MPAMSVALLDHGEIVPARGMTSAPARAGRSEGSEVPAPGSADPAFAPGVSHWEPGGLGTRDVIELIHDMPAPLVGADVVELNPIRDPDGRTAMVAGRLVKEIAGQMYREDA